MSDRELVERYRAGDKNAWNILCKRYSKKLFEFFKRRVGNYEDAKDLAQDTLIEAMVNLSQLRNPESFRGWLYEIARGILAKYFRDRHKWGIHEPIDDGVLETRAPYAAPRDQQPDNLVIAQEHLEIVRSLVDQLPESERKVLRLKLDDPDMTLKAIAEALGISVSTVKVRKHRATKKLQKWLTEEYPGEFTYLFE